MARAHADRYAAVRAALERARRELPAAAARWATDDPAHADSIHTLAYFDELMEQVEFEVALYALGGIAKGAEAGPECWEHIEEAARLMQFGPRERARAYLR